MDGKKQVVFKMNEPENLPEVVPALEVEGLTVAYGKQTALWELSFALPQGVSVAVVGPNGAGKSTLLKSCVGILTPLAGSIQLLGSAAKRVRRRVAFVPQREAVDWDFPICVEELVKMGRFGHVGLLRPFSRRDRAAVDWAMEKCGIADLRKRQIGHLSGGQQQRAFLARALAQEADLYLLDEPFAGVDAATEELLIQLMRELVQGGKTFIAVHHNLASLEEAFDWVLLLNTRQIAVGPFTEVMTPDCLKAAYGSGYRLLTEALTLSRQAAQGFPH